MARKTYNYDAETTKERIYSTYVYICKDNGRTFERQVRVPKYTNDPMDEVHLRQCDEVLGAIAWLEKEGCLKEIEPCNLSYCLN